MAFDDLELSKTLNGYICFPFLHLFWFLSFPCQSSSDIVSRGGRYTDRHELTGRNLSTKMYHLYRSFAPVLRSHKSLSFAYVFNHCYLKTSEFKPLKHKNQHKRTHFSICMLCMKPILLQREY